MSMLVKNLRLPGLLILVCLSTQGVAQKDQDEVCGDPVYGPREVTQRAKIIAVREPQYTEEARAKGVRGTVVLTAVFCRTGKVTNIEVIKSLPYGLTERAVESTRGIKFKPAEKDGALVSQRFRRECSFYLY